MASRCLFRRVVAASVAVGLVSGPVFASAPANPSFAPFVALSALASSQSRDALCGVAASNAAGTAAASAAADAAATTAATTDAAGQPVTTATPGCLFPVTDAPPVPVAEALPPPGGFPMGWTALRGAAGAAVLAALTLFGQHHNDRTPLSPA